MNKKRREPQIGIFRITNNSSNKKDLFILLLLCLGVCIIYQFIFKQDLIITDALRYNGYQAYIILYSIKHFHQLGLWDQFLSSGMSWISHPGGPLFSPITWIIFLLSQNVVTGTRIMVLGEVLLAVLSLFFFFRVLKINRFIAASVCIMYVSNQYIAVLTANGFMEELFAHTLIPLTAGLLWLSLTKRKFIYAILCGFAMSLHFFQNTYFVFHYNVIVLLTITVFFFIHDIWCGWNKRENLTDIFLFYGKTNLIIYLVMIGISSIKLLPLLEFRQLSSRNIVPLSDVENPGGVLTFNYFFDRIHNFFFPIPSAVPINNFVLQVVNNLANITIVFGCIYAVIKRQSKLLIICSVFFIGIWGFFANLIPIDFYKIMYFCLPGFNSNQFPYRFFIIINFTFFVLLALSLDLLLRLKQTRFIQYTIYIISAFMMITTASYMFFYYQSLSFPTAKNIEHRIAERQTFSIVKPSSFNKSPKIVGNPSKNSLLYLLSKLLKTYYPEGRVYSTVLSGDDALMSITALIAEVPSVHHSYEAIVPTYQYGIITPQTSTDSLELTRKRYKIFSVLNVRFQIQQQGNIDYAGCKPLQLPKTNVAVQKLTYNNVCLFLEDRLSPIITKENGGIYYDKNVLSKITMFPKSILLISDNRFGDYSAFLAKQVLFHPDFDEQKVSILTTQKSYLDDYSLRELQQFSAVFLINPEIRNVNYTNNLLQEYKKSGGKVIKLNSRWVYYENLQKRSASILTNKPAWNYSSMDKSSMSHLFLSWVNKREDIYDFKIKTFTPENILVSTVTKNNNTVLQYSDSFFPGWKASLDGNVTPVYMADGIVKGIIIPQKGKHIVRFFYDPDSLKYGLMITAITLLVLLFLLLSKTKKRLQVDV